MNFEGEFLDSLLGKSLPEPRARSGRPPIEGSSMSKSQIGRKRASQVSSPTGQSETPPAPPARQTEPLRVEERGVPAPFSPRRKDHRPSSEQIAIHAY